MAAGTATVREEPASEGGPYIGKKRNGGDDESVAEAAASARLADGHRHGAGNRADRYARTRKDGFDLRDGPAHLWMGPLVAGTHQAAAYAGARILRRYRAGGRRSQGSQAGRFCQCRNACEL